ncbi:MAG TPA: hypothetical protein VL241_08415 [Gemmatimonadales bacterium]|nr:hypothetical protein [Gemmatimonadales bacterium]
MRRSAGWLALLCWVSAPLCAQDSRWAVGISLGVSSFSGASAGTGPQGEATSFTPYRPTLWGVRASFGSRIRGGIAVAYGQAGLAIRGAPTGEGGGDLLVIAENAYDLASFQAVGSTRLLRLRGGPSLRLWLGAELARWTAPGTPARSLAGGLGGLGLEFALTRSLVASIEGELGLTPGSPFLAAELPDGTRTRSTWRRTLTGALAWRF